MDVGRDPTFADTALHEELHALRMREAQLRLILEGIHDHAISMLDASGAIVTWNASAERIKGYTLEEVRGRHFRILFTDRDRAAGVPEKELAVASSTGRFIGDGLRQRKDGSLFFAAVSLSALRDDRGILRGYVKVTHDITDRKRALDELAESERRFRAVFDNALDAMLIGNDAQEIVDVNPAACELLRTTRESLIGRRSIELLSNESRERAGDNWRRLHREGGLRGEARICREDGTSVDIEYAATANVVPGRHFAVWRDVGARKRTEAWLSFLAEASTTLSSSLDLKESVANMTALAVPMLADWACTDILESDGAIRRSAVAHREPDKVALVYDIARRWPNEWEATSGVAAVIRTGRPELHTEVTEEWLARMSNPELLEAIRVVGLRSYMCVPLIIRGWVMGAVTFAITDSQRRFGSAELTIAQDLARRAAIAIDNARLHESEQSARRHADLANHAKDEFIATLSHELRTPLNAMLGWARLLRAGTVSEEKKQRAIEIIERSALTQAQLIEDLLDISRIVSGKLRLEPRFIEPTPLVQQAIDGMRPSCEAKGIRLVAVLEADTGPIWADANRLQQVIWNLLSNATKFTPAGGEIDVRLTRAGAELQLCVRDTGCGIAPEFLSLIFERFEQADVTTSRAQRGLGLGLAISRHIVEQHGGRIEVHSDGLGRGATFTVVLPVGARSPASVASAPHVTEPPSLVRHQLDGLKVLIVDDEEDSRDLVAAVLMNCGANVTTANDADDAFAKILSQKPDILLSDIGLAGTDGYQLIRRIRDLAKEDGADIPAAALTAYVRAEDRRKALEAGFMEHLGKPVEPSELIEVALRLARYRART